MHDLVMNELGQALFCYRYRGAFDLPWHGLGQRFEREFTLEELAANTDMYRDISLVPAYYLKPDGTPVAMEGVFAVIDSSGRYLGNVKSRYTVVQDYQVIQALRPLVDKHGFKPETGGLLKGGARMFVSLTRGLEADVRPGDSVRTYLTFTNSHDGSSPFTAFSTDIRPVCSNTVRAGMRNAKGKKEMLTLRHTASITDAVPALVSAYECSFAEQVDIYRAMARRAVTAADLDAFLTEYTGTKADEQKRSGGLRDQITEAFEEGIGNTDSTVWDLFNGVTQVISHSVGRGSDSIGDKAARALESQMFGAGAKQIARAQAILERSL